jgi:hypothetical protein
VARWLIFIGVAFIVTGLLVMLGAKLGLPKLGRLPGDIVYRGKNTTIYFPVVTCLLVSVVLTLLFSLFQRFR